MQDYIPRTIDINDAIDTVYVKQYDNLSRFLHIQIIDKDLDNEGVNIANCHARMYVEPNFGYVSDDNIAYIDGEIADAENGIITFLLPNGITQNIGDYNCEIYISKASDKSTISTKPFIMKVIKSIRRDGILEGTKQFSALENALMTADDLDERITNIVIPIDHLSEALQEPSIVINSGTVSEMLKIAQTYFDYAYTPDGQDSGFLYESHTGLYSESLGSNAKNGQYGIVCSSFVDAILNGIAFENSRYNGRFSNGKFSWGIEFDDTIPFGATQNPSDAEINNKYLTSQALAKYAYEHGYLFPIDNNHKIRAGDIVFAGNVEGRFLGIDHVAIVINTDGTYCTVIESYPNKKIDINGTKHDVALRINCHENISTYTYAATFPIGSVQNEPEIIESSNNLIGQTSTKNTLIHQFKKNINKGFYTIVCHGKFDKTPYISVIYDGATSSTFQGDMMRLRNDYYATIYVQKSGYIMLRMSEDNSYDITEIALYKGYAEINAESAKSIQKRFCGINEANKLSAGDNLNDFKVGVWYCQNTTTAQSIINSPLGPNAQAGFRLETMRMTESERYMQTVWYVGIPDKMYVRMYLSTGWTNWIVYSGEAVV